MSAPLSETFTIPVGPLHVALEEPMYFRVDVDGETITGVDINAGHVHRGIEYLATKRSLAQNVVLTERICSLCSNSHPESFAMAVETIGGLEVPERGAYLRVIAGELKRVASNLFNVAILAHLVGYEALFMHVMQVREDAQDLKEAVFGNRMNLGAICIGGTRYDLDGETTDIFAAALDKLEPRIQEILSTYKINGSIQRRTRGVGVLRTDDDRLPPDVLVLEEGDVWSRALIRLHEALDAIRILRAALKDLPDGPVNLGEIPEIPPGRAVSRSEAPRGELLYYLKTGETEEPERLKWRVPSFPNWDALTFMLNGAKVADIAIIVNSIDPCVSCTER
jgi:Ni,Fe-hydrogenase III large subunit